MDYKYICIECRNTFEPEFNKLKCTSGDCKYLDTSCYDIIFENGLPKLSEFQREEEVIKWDQNPLRITLNNNYQFLIELSYIFRTQIMIS